MANSKKIKIKATLKDLVNVLNELNVNTNCIDFELTLPDNKDTYKKLSTLEGVIDWDFIETEEFNNINELNEIPYSPNNYEKIKEVNFLDNNEDNSKFDTFLEDINNFKKLSILVESIRILGNSDSNNNLVFGSDLFTQNLEIIYDEVCNRPATIDILTLELIIQSYYESYMDNSLLQNKHTLDTIEKLKSVWGNIRDYAASYSIAKVLYGK